DVRFAGADDDADLLRAAPDQTLHQVFAYRARSLDVVQHASADGQQLLGERQRLDAAAASGGGYQAPHDDSRVSVRRKRIAQIKRCGIFIFRGSSARRCGDERRISALRRGAIVQQLHQKPGAVMTRVLIERAFAGGAPDTTQLGVVGVKSVNGVL